MAGLKALRYIGVGREPRGCIKEKGRGVSPGHQKIS